MALARQKEREAELLRAKEEAEDGKLMMEDDYSNAKSSLAEQERVRGNAGHAGICM